MRFVFISLFFLASVFLIGRFVSPEIANDIENIKDIKDIKDTPIAPAIKDSSPVVKAIIIQSNTSLEEAKVLYAKAFNLFLINLGLNLDRDKQKLLKEILLDPVTYIEGNSSNTQVFIPREIDFTPTKWFDKYIKDEQADLKNISDDKLISDLQGFFLKDPVLYFARSTHIKTFSKIKHLSGDYKAELFRITGKNKGRIDQVSMFINFQIKGEASITGDFKLKISHDGNIYTNSSGSGGNGNIRINNNSIIIEAGPGRFFHFKKGKINNANFYEEGKLTGFARFTK